MATEQVQLGYSPKNIPISNKWNYRQSLVTKTKSFLRAVTWKATFFLKKATPNNKETFGFKSSLDPKRLPELKEFENKILDLIQNIEFKDTNHHVNDFQSKLRNNMKQVKENPKVFVKGDKTNNYHTMTKEIYQQHINSNVQKCYKKCPPTDINKLIKEEKKIASKLGLADRMDIPEKLMHMSH